MASKKVSNFIKKYEYIDLDSQYTSCYLSALLLNKNSFSNKEKLELFEYFFGLIKKEELESLYIYDNKTSNYYNPLTSEFFDSIKDDIVNIIEKEIINILKKDNINSKDIFNLFDYITCIHENIENTKIIEYLNKILIEIKNILSISYVKQDEENIITSLNKISTIKNIKLSDIKENFYNLIIIANNSKKIKVELLNTLLSYIPEEIDYIKKEEDILIFIISTFHDYLSNIFDNVLVINYHSIYHYEKIRNIIEKIDSISLLLKLFNDIFLEYTDIFSILQEAIFVPLIIASRIIKLDISKIENINNKNTFFDYICWNIDVETFSITVYKEEINFSALKDILFYYILDNFNYSKTEFIYNSFLLYYIDRESIYNQCSKDLKKYRIYISNSTYDFIFNIKENDEDILKLLSAKRESLMREQLIDKKIEVAGVEEEKEKINCIKNFFILEELEKDIKQIIEEFDNKDIITREDIFELENKYNLYQNKNFNINIFNPFLISYLKNIIFYHNNKLSINNTFNILIKTWDKYSILHLYNYLISIKKYDYEFDNKEKEKIRHYFSTINFNFPKYILVHLETVFGFEIDLSRFSTDEDIIELISYDYYYLKYTPREVLIIDKVLIKSNSGIIGTSLEEESFNFSNILTKLKKDKNEVFELCLKNLNIKESSIFYSNQYYLLLSTINIYNILDNKDDYKDIIKNIVIEYFYYTLKEVDGSFTISNLLINTAEKNNLLEKILNLILEYNIIEVSHYNLITKWQNEIFFNNLDNHKSLEIIFKIRSRIKNDDIIIKNTNSINYDKIDIKRTLLDDLDNLKMEISYSDNGEKMLSLFRKFNKKANNLIKEGEENINYKNSNIVELLLFLDKDDNIFEDFCNIETIDINLQYNTINYFNYIFNNIKEYKDSFNKITKVILQKHNLLEKKIEYSIDTFPKPIFQLRDIFEHIINKIIIIDYRLSQDVYDNLSLTGETIVKGLPEKIDKKLKSFILPIKIYKKKIDNDRDQYIIENRFNKEDICRDDKECIDNIMNRIFAENRYISRILEFEHLIDDIKNKCITMSHPYLFEDDNENNYPINKQLYISCFSYTIRDTNAYAWWKIYGSKTKFRMTIEIEHFIKSIISILDSNDVEIYLGSLDYKKELKQKNKIDWDFFDKREDFSFENELRLMIKINQDSKQDEIKKIKGLPVLYKFKMQCLDMYKNISTNDKEDTIFHPYDKTLLEKDKKAMLSILKKELKELSKKKD